MAASMFWVLAGSMAWAQPEVPAGELEALKRMMQEINSQNEELRKRIEELEAATKERQATEGAAKEEPGKEPTKEPAKGPAEEALPEPPPKEPGGWWDRIELGGAIEVDVFKATNFTHGSESGIQLSTAEFDLEAKLTDWAKAMLVLAWDSEEDKITVDEALLEMWRDPFSLRAGRGVLPFGLSTGTTVAARLEDTLTLTDPLTLAVFETREDHALLEVRAGGFHAGAYIYEGETNRRRSDKKKLEHYGAAIGYGAKTATTSVTGGISWIDSVFDSDGLSAAFPEALTARHYAPGVAAHVKFGLRGLSLVGAYYTATRKVRFIRDDRDIRIKPEAWHVEVAYTTPIFTKVTYLALGYSETEKLAGAFPETRSIATVGTWLANDMRLTFDYAHDEDYRRVVGGTGRDADAFTVRLTYEW